MPGAAGELVDLVAGVLPEESRQSQIVRGEHVHGEVSGLRGHAVGVVLVRQAHQEAARMDADLRGETDQAACPLTTCGRGHDEHRVVELRDQCLEGCSLVVLVSRHRPIVAA